MKGKRNRTGMGCKTAIMLFVKSIVFMSIASAVPEKAIDIGFEGDGGSDGWEIPLGWRIEQGAGRNGSAGLVWECRDPNRYTYPRFKFKAEPGGVYLFSCYVKVDSLSGEKPMPNMLNVSIDWSDTTGKWMAGAYAHSVADNDPASDGWVRYEGETPYLPMNVGSANVLCFMPRGCVGRVRFDDFRVVPLPPCPVDYLQCSAYRNEFSRGDGPVRFIASLHVNPFKNPLGSLRGELVFDGSDGRRQVVETPVLDLSHAEVEVPPERFALGAQTAMFRLVSRADGVDIASTSLKVRCTETPRRRRVAIDAKGRALLDGKPFFPLGLYAGRMTDEDLAEWKKGPFNFAVQYHVVTAKDLDRWQSVGVFVAPDIRRFIYGYNYSAIKSPHGTLEESGEALRKLISDIGSHPALFAWYLVDETPVRFAPNVRAVNELLQELDPDHPTYTVTDKPKDIVSLLPCFDAVGVDPYPIGNSDGRGRISICSDWADVARRGTFGMRALWHVPQTFSWAWYRKKDAAVSRMPTRQEMANMTWQLIASGANGLCSYAFYPIRRNMHGEDFDKAWADVCAVAWEVKSAESVLLSDELSPSISGIPEKSLAVRTFRLRGEDWIIIANRTSAPVKATLESPCEYAFVENVFGGGASLLPGRRIAIDFQPLGYAVVRAK